MEKAQGALEYLLLIGGGVLVSVIVVTLLLGLSDTSKENVEATTTSGFSRIAQAREELVGGGETVVLNLAMEESGSFSESFKESGIDYHRSVNSESIVSSSAQKTTGGYSYRLTGVADTSSHSFDGYSYTYIRIWSGSHIVQNGDVLKYNTFVPDSQRSQAGIEMHFTVASGGGFLRWVRVPSQDSVIFGGWQDWEFDLSGLAGKDAYKIMLVTDGGYGSPEGNFIVYYDNIRIVNEGGA